MKKIRISDITLRESDQLYTAGLSFKEKIEIAKNLERLRVDVIELGRLTEKPADSALLRTLSATITESALCVPVTLNKEEIDRAWDSLSKAPKARMNITAPASTVQMEYLYHTKPKKVLELITELVAYAVALCPEIEFTAEDATRSEKEFLAEMLSAAINAGAKYVTVCDSTGEMLPEELEAFVKGLYNDIPALVNAELCVQCRDSIGLASAAAVAAVGAGAAGLKMTSSPASGFLTMGQITRILQIRGEALGIETELNLGEWQRICRYLEGLTDMNRNGHSAFNSATGSATESETESEELSADADKLTVRRHIVAMGYDVSDDDMEHIYYLFRELAAKKAVSNRDLEAIVAEAAHQVAPSYQLDNYVINSGSTITATAYLRINHEGKPIQTVSIGDGPIDAAFLAIEQAVGHHFELEDFKIRAVTEGREALGEALVKLRSGGKLFSGRGISTDIIGAAIRAYMSAVNKIVYEENNI